MNDIDSDYCAIFYQIQILKTNHFSSIYHRKFYVVTFITFNSSNGFLLYSAYKERKFNSFSKFLYQHFNFSTNKLNTALKSPKVVTA